MLSIEVAAALLGLLVLVHIVTGLVSGITTIDGALVRHNRRPFIFWGHVLLHALTVSLFAAASVVEDHKARSVLTLSSLLLLTVQTFSAGHFSFWRGRLRRQELGEPPVTTWIILTMTTLIWAAALGLGIVALTSAPFAGRP